MKINPCPFCGNARATVVTSCIDLETCGCFESCSNRIDDIEGIYLTVVCNVNKGGCGATSGFSLDKDDAISKWNGRA